jgi:ribonucleoside-diphosphate reductase alpha chain
VGLFDRAITYNKNWVHEGHRSGDNTNNVSCTISVKNEEWDGLREAMWKKRNSYSGISLLPYSDHTYRQSPFEDCTKETYDKYMQLVTDVDLKQVREEEDNTVRTETLSCVGGVCAIE